MERGPGLKMYFLLKMVTFQPAMLVYQRVLETSPMIFLYPQNQAFSRHPAWCNLFRKAVWSTLRPFLSEYGDLTGKKGNHVEKVSWKKIWNHQKYELFWDQWQQKPWAHVSLLLCSLISFLHDLHIDSFWDQWRLESPHLFLGDVVNDPMVGTFKLDELDETKTWKFHIFFVVALAAIHFWGTKLRKESQDSRKNLGLNLGAWVRTIPNWINIGGWSCSSWRSGCRMKNCILWWVRFSLVFHQCGESINGLTNVR